AIAETARVADEANIKLSPKQIDQIAAQVAAAWVEQRKRGLSAGEISIEELVRAALNEALAVGAQPLLPGTTAYWALDSTFIRPNKPGVAEYQEGGFSNWVVKQTSTSMEYRTVKNGEVTADLSVEFKYDSPPKYLRPGDTLELQASGKITARKDFERLYEFKLYYNSSAMSMGSYVRSSSGSRTFKIEVPPLPGDRERFSIRVGIEALNCKADSCNATWVYEPRAGPMPAE
ncbi:MAG: hypothetical protein V3S82_04230, partial [Dehalococcoidia bacterium]